MREGWDCSGHGGGGSSRGGGGGMIRVLLVAAALVVLVGVRAGLVMPKGIYGIMVCVVYCSGYGCYENA